MDTNTGELRARHLTGCDLLERCVSSPHDEDWREFTQRYGPMIRTWVRSILTRHRVRYSPEEVEEHVQDFYLRLLASAGRRFRGRTDVELRRFLLRVIRNQVNDRRRHVERHGAVPAEAVLPWMAPPPPSPERRIMARQRLARFLECCRRAASDVDVELKLRVISLAFLDGCSSREIAWRLAGEITARQVDLMIYRLRRRLERHGFEVPRRRLVAMSAASPLDWGSRRPLSIDR